MAESIVPRDRVKTAAIIGIAGVIIFLVLSTINMFLYPGSYHIGPVSYYSDRYMFTLNNLSDMGMLYTFKGAPNFLSAIVFAITLTLTGISYLMFVRFFPYVFPQDSKSFKIAHRGSIYAMISAAAYIGVGWTPWDIAGIPHMLFVFISFVLSIVFNIMYGIAILRDESYPNWYAYALFSYVFILFVYVLILGVGPSTMHTVEGRILESLGQKIVIYLQMSLIVINAIGMLKTIKKRTED